VNDVSTGGDAEIQREIQSVMTPCSGMVVVIGDDTHNSPWINYEVGYATSQRIPTVAVQHPQSRGVPPNNYRGMKVVGWNSQELADIVQSWPTR
jgi:hypothetical protein